MVERLGNVLYWTGCVLGALALLAGIFLGLAMMDSKDQIFATGLGVLAGTLIWATGRACRYVLTGK